MSTDTLNVVEALRATGCTYRQLHYWVQLRLVRVERYGSGVPLRYPPSEIQVATIIRTLSELGFDIREAAKLARRYLDRDPEGQPVDVQPWRELGTAFHLAPGVAIVLGGEFDA